MPNGLPGGLGPQRAGNNKPFIRSSLHVCPPDFNLCTRRNVRRRNRAAGQYGRACLRGRVSGRHLSGRHDDQDHHCGLSRRPVPYARRHHLPVRHRAEQRHDRVAGSAWRAGGAWANRRNSVDHVLHRRGSDGGRRRQPCRRCNHRPDRPGLRREIRHQPAAHGAHGRARCPRRRLLAHQYLRRHHQQDRRTRRTSLERAHHDVRQPGRELRGVCRAVHVARGPQAARPESRRTRRSCGGPVGRRAPYPRGGRTGGPADLRRCGGRG